MTPKTQQLIDRVRELTPFEKYPIVFLQYPDVTEILDAAPLLARALEIAVKTLTRVAECRSPVQDVLDEIESLIGEGK